MLKIEGIMGQVGSILLEARKNKGLDISQVALDTNIEKIYIEALENDDYKKIPAEAYVLGFLRNYSEYLGLDANEIIRQYRNTKIEDLTVPQEILLPKKNPPVLKIASILFFSVVIVTAFYFGLKFFLNHNTTRQTSSLAKAQNENHSIGRKSQEYELDPDSPLEKEVFKGDSFKASIGEDDFVVTVLSTYPNLKVDLAGKGDRIIETSETKLFDLDGDEISDIEISVNGIAKDENDGLMVLVSSGRDIGKDQTNDLLIGDIVAREERQTKGDRYKTYFTGKQPYPIVLNAEFSGYSLFRVDLDKKNRIEQFYQRGAKLENLKAQNVFRVWASNGFVVKCVLIAGGISKDLGVIGKPGEVVVKDFKWIKNDKTGEFYFVEMDVD